jgi:hypothetical protein
MIASDLIKPKNIGYVRPFSTNVCIRFCVGRHKEGSMLVGREMKFMSEALSAKVSTVS